MKFVLSLCLIAGLFATMQAAAVDSTTAQEKVADQAHESNESNESNESDETTVAPTEASDVIEECHQPKETGRCFALFYRYAYNVESRQCEEFIYGGCNGNKNNFESKEACEQKCLQKVNNDDAPQDKEESSTPAKAEKDDEGAAVPVVPAVDVVQPAAEA